MVEGRGSWVSDREGLVSKWCTSLLISMYRDLDYYDFVIYGYDDDCSDSIFYVSTDHVVYDSLTFSIDTFPDL